MVTATKVGTTDLSVEDVTDDADWLTVTAPATADGLGTYTLVADRGALADGSYAAKVTFTLSTGATVELPVSLRIGVAPATGDVGFLYAILVNSSFTTVAQVQGRGTAGAYTFQFTGVPPGSYLVVAGTDSDDDNSICDVGEACGAWPTLGVPTPVEVTNANVSGLDFVATFPAPLAAGARADGAARPTGFRLLKRGGGAR
jgi:serine protease